MKKNTNGGIVRSREILPYSHKNAGQRLPEKAGKKSKDERVKERYYKGKVTIPFAQFEFIVQSRISTPKHKENRNDRS